MIRRVQDIEFVFDVCGRRKALKALWAFVMLISLLFPAALLAQQAESPGMRMDEWTDQISQQIKEGLRTVPEKQEVTPGRRTSEVSNQPEAANSSRFEQKPTLGISTLKGILNQEGLPTRLISIVAVESGFDNAAVSSKGAAGLWQLMPATARRFGLVVSPERDDRFNPFKATVAAASYLKLLYSEFHSWPMVLAAYNTGGNRLGQVLQETHGSSFWAPQVQSHLPLETRRYVRKVLTRMDPKSLGLSSKELRSMALLESAGDGASMDQSNRPAHVVFAAMSPDVAATR